MLNGKHLQTVKLSADFLMLSKKMEVFPKSKYSKISRDDLGYSFCLIKCWIWQNLNQNCKWSGIQSAELITLDGERDGSKVDNFTANKI